MAYEWETYIRSVIYSFIFVTGIIGNIFVMFFFGLKMKRAPNFRWFVIHLAIADCTYALLSPVQLLYLMISKGKWQLGTILCKSIYYIGPITINVSAFVLCFMAYERYRAICYPFKERLSKRLINGIVALIWIVCILIKVPVMMRLNVDGGECLLMVSGNTELTLISLSFLLCEGIIPLSLLSIFFVRITIALKKHECFRENSDARAFLARAKKENATKKEAMNTRKVELPGRVHFTNNMQHLRLLSECSTEPSSPSHERVYFTLSRGRAYSSQDDAFSAAEDTELTETYPQSVYPLQYHGNRKESNFTENVRHGYTNFKKFVRNHTSASLHTPLKLFGVRDKRDRATVKALFLSVALFALTSVPYNLYYFILVCLLLYCPSFYPVFVEHEKLMISINEWLGVLMLSGCIMNIIVYSGKFPEFRQQAFTWVSKFNNSVRKLSTIKNNAPEYHVSSSLVSPTCSTSVCNGSSYMTSSHFTGHYPSTTSRNENNYVKV